MKQMVFIVALLSLVFVTALQVVSTRHQTRQLVVQLQELRTHESELEREWGQLLLEHGTWGTHGRVEQLARTKLDMTVPLASEIRHVRP